VHPATPVKELPAKGGKASTTAEVAKTPPASIKPASPARPVLPPDVGTVTGLHIPRYVSLKTDDVNMRAGPAPRFPILWTYKRLGLPVKIEREFDTWRLVEDMDGVKGWLHQATLSGRRGFVITGDTPRELRASASEDADAVAILKPNVVGRLRGCAAGAAWCEVEVAGYRGWLRRDWFWGTDPGEAVQP
jgi:SH3-like domain-containing protein